MDQRFSQDLVKWECKKKSGSAMYLSLKFVCKAHNTSAQREVPHGRGPGPAEGPWKLWLF